MNGKYTELLKWADENEGVLTAAQHNTLRVFCTSGNTSHTARELGVVRGTVRSVLTRIEAKAARSGFAPHADLEKPAPAGYHIKGASTLYDADGVIRAQWVKTQADADTKLQQIRDALEALAEPYHALADPAPVPTACNADLLCVYPLGDPHLGLYSWAAETGVSWDLRRAEKSLVRACENLVAVAPPAEKALVISLGDFFHSDNYENKTARSGASLDVDTRWPKVFRTGVRAMRSIIDNALIKHKHVDVICEIGNHDDQTSIALATVLDSFYDREPRVTINTEPTTFHYYQFGKCLLGTTHGHRTKAQDLGGVMACDRPKAWGETLHRYWYVGHVHHDSVKEYAGVTVESFRTLAPGDAWHRAQGYRSGRDLKCDVLHREYGRISRHIIGVNQVVP